MTTENRPATIRVRLKGNADGPVYHGQQLVQPCRTCGGKSSAVAAPADLDRETQEELMARHLAAVAEIDLKATRLPVRYTPPPPPRNSRRPLHEPVLTLSPEQGIEADRIEIHTLRFGSKAWLLECAPTLDDWCQRHGMHLTVWPEPEPGRYPAAKFAIVDMLRAFVAGKREWMMFVDADVFIHPAAPTPTFLAEKGFFIATDRPSQWSRGFPEWSVEKSGAAADDWIYRNSGIWACDRASAELLLSVIAPPFIEACQEQHHLNLWLLLASRLGLELHTLPEEWTRWPRVFKPAWAFHTPGGRKEAKLAMFRRRRLLPHRAESYRKIEHADTPRAIVYPWRAESAAWEELRYSLRSVQEHFEDKECPIYILAAAPPPWLKEGGRVKFILAQSYMRTISAGIQSAAEVLWMNDDIALLQPCGWEDFRMPRHVGEMTRKQQEDWHWDANTWKQGVSRAITDLTHRGRTRYNCETHTPYVWQRDQALEVLETYGLWHKIPMATLYANHHRQEMLPLAGFRTSDPAVAAPVLNYADRQITPEFIAALEAKFPQAAAWEKGGEVEK